MNFDLVMLTIRYYECIIQRKGLLVSNNNNKFGKSSNVIKTTKEGQQKGENYGSMCTCGASLPLGATRCLKCGTVVDVEAPPVQQPTPQTPQQPKVVYVQQPPQVQVPQSTKSKGAAAVLAILLGGLGAHKFYLGQPVWGVIYLIFCWTFIPEVLGIIEGIIYMTMSDAAFAQKYK